MEHVDYMILSTLAKLQCTFCEDEVPRSLESLVREDVVEGIVKLLWAIDPTLKDTIKGIKLPVHAAQKFQVATLIANTVNNFGMKDPIGYHTLLYANVFETRRIFLTLIERLPKERVWVEKSLSNFENLATEVAAKIRIDQHELWVPEFCRYLKMKHDGRFWCQADAPEFINFRSSHYAENEKLDIRHLLCQSLTDTDTFSFPSTAVDFLSFSSNRPVILPKPKIGPKPAPKPRAPPRKIPPIPDTNHVDASMEIEKLAAEIALIKAEVDSHKHEILELRYAENRLEDEIAWYKEVEVESDQKLLELLQNPNTAQEIIKKEISQLHANDLQAQDAFLQTQEELRHQIASTRLAKGLTSDNEQKRNQLREMHELIAEKKRTIAESQRQITKLQNKIGDGVSDSERLEYQSRIIEIMANIDEQLKERQRIFEAVRKLEKEIKHLTGNLGRTYMVVEAWMLNESGRDEQLHRAYNDMMTMHERCLSIRKILEECGTATREIDDLTDEIELETQNTSASRLQELMADISQIRQENNAISEEISALTTS